MSIKTLTVQVLRLPHAQGLHLPSYATMDSAGVDLKAAVWQPMTVLPMGRASVPTGLCLSIPPGWEGQVRARSGLALKNGITMANGVGTIDTDYRGEVCVLLVNLSTETFLIERGMRIAQMVFARVGHVEWDVVERLGETERGTGGFGSTGVQS
jgi:dUTP pyrophosphatase